MRQNDSQQIVIFGLGDEQYALPIAAVSEIIRYTTPRSVASDIPWLRGVIGLRGTIIPIFDLAARCALPAGTSPEKIVIVESGGVRAGDRLVMVLDPAAVLEGAPA